MKRIIRTSISLMLILLLVCLTVDAKRKKSGRRGKSGRAVKASRHKRAPVPKDNRIAEFLYGTQSAQRPTVLVSEIPVSAETSSVGGQIIAVAAELPRPEYKPKTMVKYTAKSLKMRKTSKSPSKSVVRRSSGGTKKRSQRGR